MDTRYLMNPHACEADKLSQRERDRNEFLRQKWRAVAEASEPEEDDDQKDVDTEIYTEPQKNVAFDMDGKEIV